jgi:hypothetical protein
MTVREAKQIIRKVGYRLLEDLSARDIEKIQKRFPKYYNRHISFLEADVESGKISTTDALLVFCPFQITTVFSPLALLIFCTISSGVLTQLKKRFDLFHVFI